MVTLLYEVTMSLLSLITKKAPSLNYGSLVISFDAVLEDTLEASVTLSDYPIEVGSRSNDHRIKNPVKWSIRGAVSNNPLFLNATDFSGLISDVSDDTGELSGTAGIFAGWLNTSDSDRATSALDSLLKLMYEGDPFDVDAGDRTLSNMVIQSIRRTKEPSNENGIIFYAELIEWQSIETAISAATGKTYAQSGSDTASAASNKVELGQQSTTDAGDSLIDTVSGWFS